MATQQAVNSGSQFCRDCGGPVQPQAGLSWCANTTTSGSQQDPKDVCQNLPVPALQPAADKPVRLATWARNWSG